MKLETWISSLYVKKTFSDIPDEWVQTDSQYREVKETYPLVEFVVNRRSMVLMTLSEEEAKKSFDNATDAIEKRLISSRRHKKNVRYAQVVDSQSPSGIADAQTGHTYDGPKEVGENLLQSTKTVDRFIPWPPEYMEVCKMFLQSDIDNIKRKYRSLQIELKGDGLMIKHANRFSEVQQDVSSLKMKIKRQIETFVFPGLLPFLRSEDGECMLAEIASKFQCQIKIHGRGRESTNDFLETLEMNRTCYQGILLGTARHRQGRIHLVQGNPINMNVDMIVYVCTSGDGKFCFISFIRYIYSLFY